MSGKQYNIYSLFQARFPQDHEAIFIETADGAQYSYAYLETETARIARFLTSQGIKKGDRVTVQVEVQLLSGKRRTQPCGM